MMTKEMIIMPEIDWTNRNNIEAFEYVDTFMKFLCKQPEGSAS